LGGYTKANYKGDIYIPWATMERMVYTQDPEASVEVVRVNNDYDGGLVFNQSYNIQTHQKTNDKEVITSANVYYPMVIIKASFLGKEILEYYPIQDKAYDAPKAIDQNMLNKSIQRAKVKALARVSGLGLKVYEGFDLQFDAKEENEPKQQEQPKKVEQSKKVEPKTTVNVETPKQEQPSNDLLDVATYLHNNAKELEVGIQKMNANIVAKYGADVVMNLEKDSIEELVSKLGKIDKPLIFLKAVKNQSGVQ
jgi:hypothetical protein